MQHWNSCLYSCHRQYPSLCMPTTGNYSPFQLPSGTYKSSPDQREAYARQIATQVVEQCKPVKHGFKDREVINSGDYVYNYACILCLLGSLVQEFTDGWAEGDGDRVYWCWRFLLPHFKSANHGLEALQIQFSSQSGFIFIAIAHQSD